MVGHWTRSVVRIVALGGLVAAPLSVVALTAEPAAATTVVVSTPAALRTQWVNPPGPPASLTIQLANDITLDCSINELDRTTTHGDVVLDGQGHTLSENCTSMGIRETLEVSGTSDNVTVQNLTLTTAGGNNIGAIEMENNGLILGTGGLTLNAVTMTNNHNNGGGAVEVTNAGTADLTITNSTFTNNTSCSGGGAIEYRTGGNLVITGSTFANNQANRTGGAFLMDGTSHDLTMTNSTITGNTALRVGGIAVNHGHAALTYVTDVNNTTGASLSSCSLSAGSSQSSDDDEATDPPEPDPTTRAQANGDTPANLRVDQTNAARRGVQNLTTFATVFAQPHGGPNCGDLSGPPTGPLTNTVSQGFNFADDTSCGLTGTGDSQAATNDPKLGALADNGGRNPTLLPQTGSPLIGLVPLASCGAGQGITIDERMLPRPDPADLLGPGCDTGAVEIQLPAPLVVAPKFTG